jgi:hypothetical protein
MPVALKIEQPLFEFQGHARLVERLRHLLALQRLLRENIGYAPLW